MATPFLRRYQHIFAYIIGLFSVHAVLIVTQAYETLWWSDVVMHTAGGVGAGLIAIALLTPTSFKNVPALLGAVGIVALIGVGWEWLEFFIDQPNILWPSLALHAGPQQLGLADTMFDLFFDLLGGVVAIACGLIASSGLGESGTRKTRNV